jgi:hypothetical protein
MRALRASVALLAIALAASAAQAQKTGGILRLQHIDNPPSASIHEEGTQSTVLPFMAIYNNLVVYGVCLQPYVKNITYMVNSVYNGFRYEDAWLDK